MAKPAKATVANKAKSKNRKPGKAAPPSAVKKLNKHKNRKAKDPKTLARDVNRACKKVQRGPGASQLYHCPFRVKVKEPYFQMLWLGRGGRACELMRVALRRIFFPSIDVGCMSHHDPVRR